MGIICALERDLIDPALWSDLYDQMPEECKVVVDSPPDCLGIGRNDKYGWFIIGSGQGPCLCWSEKT